MSQPLRVSNIRHQVSGEQMTLRYDLDGKPKTNYTIRAFISLDGGQTQMPLLATKGDCGKKVQVGTDKTIYWDTLKDFPNGIQGDRIIFTVEAIAPRPQWQYWAGGTTLASGLAWGLLSWINRLPAPPDRPQ